jgi:mono/diheme cytochrome c family protein
MNYKYKIVLFLSITTLLNACYYNNEEDLLGTSGCATSSQSYKNDIAPILDFSCNACHSSTAKLGNVVLDNYIEVKKYAQSAALIGVLEQKTGYSPMPKNGAKLDTCDIAKVKAWVSQGTLNN